ncbi:permease [Streptomyces turgidiscabies]|uniref:Putative membrane protein n=1 Tax=Streptomyces turgidiscabies (strain Car8) TaxID=698760 RepID=L7FJP2_STRT8|nr:MULTISPECIES: permease [Streptomyces]ELP71301.1 putative membrane protein [Streptomyces turgidiscabies Car8]MDX3492269.1 permease [Streptomyces turgidiscabies]GAQ69439.1 putative permease [Streptomyces turgidiscabies]
MNGEHGGGYGESGGGWSVADGLRFAVRAFVYAVVGGAALLAIATVASVLGPTLALDLYTPPVAAWWTVFTAVVVQGVPFLLLGTVVSAAIGAFVPERVFTRLLPRNQALAVPIAGAAGVVLPGCECASVPVAGSLMRRGVAPAAALAFLLSAPAINPVVLVATSIAFPGQPRMVLGRLVASLVTAVVMGWLWARFGRDEWLRKPTPVGGSSASEPSGWRGFSAGLQHDFLHAGGFLVLGAGAAATFNIVVPRSVLDVFTGSAWLAVLLLAVLAVVLCVCSEADAFVAASLSGFSPTARLAFMVVGPMVDLKLIALQAGTFGRSFAVRFSSVTWVVAVSSSVVVGWWLW